MSLKEDNIRYKRSSFKNRSLFFDDVYPYWDKETMRKFILIDLWKVLLLIIRKELKTDEIESFILNALLGEILDKKTKRQIKSLYNETKRERSLLSKNSF